VLPSNICRSVNDSGFAISDIDKPNLLYNDNEACVRWSHNMISKAARHIGLREKSVREWVQDKSISVKHVAGKTNPADIFITEMHDGTHFHVYVTLSCVACPTLLILPSWKHTMLVSPPISSTILLPRRHGLSSLLTHLRISWHLPLTHSVARLQQCLIYSVRDASFFGVSIISSLLVLFDVLRFQW
jgi:hypothetical protein